MKATPATPPGALVPPPRRGDVRFILIGCPIRPKPWRLPIPSIGNYIGPASTNIRLPILATRRRRPRQSLSVMPEPPTLFSLMATWSDLIGNSSNSARPFGFCFRQAHDVLSRGMSFCAAVSLVFSMAINLSHGRHRLRWLMRGCGRPTDGPRRAARTGGTGLDE